MGKPKVFVCYAGEDKEPHLERMRTALHGLKNEEKLDPWDDGDMIPGERWKDRIDDAIRAAQIFVVLVSDDAVASDQCMRELALARTLPKLRIVPVGVRPADWPEFLKSLDPLPTKKIDKPVSKYRDKDEAWSLVKAGIRKVVERLPARASQTGDPLWAWIQSMLEGNENVRASLVTHLGLDHEPEDWKTTLSEAGAAEVVFAFHHLVQTTSPERASMARKLLGGILVRCFDYRITVGDGGDGVHELETSWAWLGAVVLAQRYGGVPVFVVGTQGEVCARDVVFPSEAGIDPHGTEHVRQLTNFFAQKFVYSHESDDELRKRINGRLKWLASPQNRLETGWALMIDRRNPESADFGHLVGPIQKAFPDLRIVRVQGGEDLDGLDASIHFALEDIYRES